MWNMALWLVGCISVALVGSDVQHMVVKEEKQIDWRDKEALRGIMHEGSPYELFNNYIHATTPQEATQLEQQYKAILAGIVDKNKQEVFERAFSSAQQERLQWLQDNLSSDDEEGLVERDRIADQQGSKQCLWCRLGCCFCERR